MQTVNQPPSKKYMLYQSLREQDRNASGEIEWNATVLENLRGVLGGEANQVQTLLYDMEHKGYIARRRRSDGRTVLSISLLQEPPAQSNVRPPAPPKQTNGASGVAKHAGEMYAEVMEITPELAERWLDFNTHNRTLRQGFIDRLCQAINRGEWVVNAETIKINEDEGVLVDGQHRLWAIVLSGKAVKALVAHNVPVAAQETIDTGIKRTLSDMLKLRGEKDNTTLAAALVQLHIWKTRNVIGLSGAHYPTPQQALKLFEVHPEIRESVGVGRRLADHIRYPSGIGAVLHWIVNQIDSEDASDFFNRLTTGVNLDEGNPILALRKTLADYGPIHTQDRLRLAALGIKAWNFYRDGTEITRLVWKSGGAKPEAFPQPK